jgi:hypothetical protein
VVRYFKDPGAFKIELIQEDPDEVARRIDARLWEAGSAAELFGESEVLHGKDYVNRPFLLTRVEFRPSDIEGQGLPFYGVFTISDYDGESHVLTCGATGVVKKAAKASSEGWLPVWVKLVKSEKPTDAGYYPLDLVSAPAGF